MDIQRRLGADIVMAFDEQGQAEDLEVKRLEQKIEGVDKDMRSFRAEVSVNGKPAGSAWHAPFRVEIGAVTRPGRNSLSVKVADLWVNRLIGDEQLPADREWVRVTNRRGFGLKEYPDWFQRGERSRRREPDLLRQALRVVGQRRQFPLLHLEARGDGGVGLEARHWLGGGAAALCTIDFQNV
mgnify:CR=1 FL=1